MFVAGSCSPSMPKEFCDSTGRPATLRPLAVLQLSSSTPTTGARTTAAVCVRQFGHHVKGTSARPKKRHEAVQDNARRSYRICLKHPPTSTPSLSCGGVAVGVMINYSYSSNDYWLSRDERKLEWAKARYSEILGNFGCSRAECDPSTLT